MGSKSIGMAFLIVAGTLSAGIAAAQQTPPQARGSKATGNESWQIEQRRRWWIESRGLDKVRGAGDMRRGAMRTLRIQMAREASAGRAAGEVWRELGPSSMRMGNWTMGRVSGRINAIAPHPTNDSILYVGSANGGVWKSTDAGTSWTPTFARRPNIRSKPARSSSRVTGTDHSRKPSWHSTSQAGTRSSSSMSGSETITSCMPKSGNSGVTRPYCPIR